MTANPASTDVVVEQARTRLQEVIDHIEQVFVGKRQVVEMVLMSLLARGHVLLEDVPGVGKTTLARAVARAIGCEFKRVQFTSDLLPADIVGVNIFDRDASEFRFKQGPVFTNLLLADEINRTTPRTQSALLEAMNEHQVTVDNVTHPLPAPFIVLATQNPLEFAGTYPLPESQMDRFLVRVTIGYPGEEAEASIIRSQGIESMDMGVEPAIQGEQVATLQAEVADQHVSDAVLNYIRDLVGQTRQSPYLSLGVSTRGAIALFRACQSLSWLRGRDHVLPDDVKELFLPVCGHRVMVRGLQDGAAERREKAENALRELLQTTAVPL